MAISTYLADKLNDHVLRSVAYTKPTIVYVALYTDDPTAGDVGTEVTGTAYERKSMSVDASSSGVTQNTTDITFPIAGSNWGTITHIGIRDASTAGNLLFFAPLTVAKAIVTDNQLIFQMGEITNTIT